MFMVEKGCLVCLRILAFDQAAGWIIPQFFGPKPKLPANRLSWFCKTYIVTLKRLQSRCFKGLSPPSFYTNLCESRCWETFGTSALNMQVLLWLFHQFWKSAFTWICQETYNKQNPTHWVLSNTWGIGNWGHQSKIHGIKWHWNIGHHVDYSIEISKKFWAFWISFTGSKPILAVELDFGLVRIVAATEWVKVLFEKPKKLKVYSLDYV